MILKKGNKMQLEEAKNIIESLGLTGADFSRLFQANKNYVSNFARIGVPQNMGIILNMAKLLKANGIKNEEIVKLIGDEIKDYAVRQEELKGQKAKPVDNKADEAKADKVTPKAKPKAVKAKKEVDSTESEK